MRALPYFVLVLLLSGCDSFGKGFEAELEKSFTKEFDQTCTDAAVKAHADREPAAACCKCLSRRLLADNGALAVGKASLQADGPEFTGMLDKAMSKCEPCPKAATL